jgi:hypothetical protein
MEQIFFMSRKSGDFGIQYPDSPVFYRGYYD